MAQCVVIADEITGGCAVGSMLEKNRCSVCSLMASKAIKDERCNLYDCLVYSTNSRNLTAEQSYQLVFYAGRLLKSENVKIYAKRIDPSMRGNTCIETQAMLDALGDNDRVAIVVPGFPTLKRINVGGYILVGGRPLQKSLVGMEDTLSDQSGRVADLFTEKFRYHAEALHLKDFQKGMHALSDKIRELADRGARAIVMDCTSQEDINLIADAVLRSGIKFLAVDPGPFTATLARKVMRDEEKVVDRWKLFGVIGGSNPLISAQVETLKLEQRGVYVVSVRNMELLDSLQKRAQEIDRVVGEVMTAYEKHKLVFAISEHLGASSQQLNDFDDMLKRTKRSRVEAIDSIASAYGQIALKVLQKRQDIASLYTTGAEYTLAVCRELKSVGVNILGQVLPLTAYGELIDGDYAGLKIIASAGSATDANTITESILYIKRKLEV